MSEPKFPVDRADLTRLPWRALALVAKVIESGDRKYHQGDWIFAPERIDGRRDLNSALRHIGEYVEGKDVDEDSGESPLAHAAARLLFLLEREARGIKGGGWRISKPRIFLETMEAIRNSTIEEMPPGKIEDWNPLADQEEIYRRINQLPPPPPVSYAMTNDELQRAIDSAKQFGKFVPIDDANHYLTKLLEIQVARARVVRLHGYFPSEEAGEDGVDPQ